MSRKRHNHRTKPTNDTKRKSKHKPWETSHKQQTKKKKKSKSTTSSVFPSVMITMQDRILQTNNKITNRTKHENNLRSEQLQDHTKNKQHKNHFPTEWSIVKTLGLLSRFDRCKILTLSPVAVKKYKMIVQLAERLPNAVNESS